MTAVDVIVPCYNYGRYLRECVHSVLDQEGVQVRVLVIDDASSDDTPLVAAELASRDERVTVRRHEQNLRHIATYNEGIEWIRAKYYLLLSADDFLLPGALRRAVDLMDADARIGFCYGAADELLPGGTRQPALREYAPRSAAPSLSMSGLAFIELCRVHGSINIVSTPTAVVRTELQRRTDGYRPELPHSGDMELWLRLAAHARVGYIGTPQAVYRWHSSNMSLDYGGENRLRDLRQRELAVDWLIRSCRHLLPNVERLRRALLAPLAYGAVSGASGALNQGRPEVAREFMQFATTVFPGVVFSPAWVRLLVKRLIGRKCSSLMIAARAALRQ